MLLDAFYIEKRWIDWSFHKLSSTTNPIVFAQISDLHIQSLTKVHKQIASRINELKPDVLFFTGDSVDKATKLEVFDQFLSEIDHHIPKKAILGNWEYWGHVDITALGQLYKKHNGELLVNENSSMECKGRKLSIIGVDDLVGGTPDFKKAISGIPPADVTITLAHCPKYRNLIAIEHDVKTDLVLSGHTHGGQINILGFIPFKPHGSGDFVKGWYKEDYPHMYVSKGIGTSILPVRLGARAEVAVFSV